MTDNKYKSGLIATFSAFIIWGLAVIFWKQIKHVDSFEILTHRVIWSFIFILIIFLTGDKYKFSRIKALSHNYKYLLLTSFLLCANWVTFIWAVNSGHVVECSLGYFINPLVNVILGAAFFGERLRKLQTVAVIFAVFGVLVLTFSYGQFPWISFILAGTFGLYGMIRKKINIDSIPGFGLEMLFAFPFATGYLLLQNYRDGIAFLNAGLSTNILIIGT